MNNNAQGHSVAEQMFPDVQAADESQDSGDLEHEGRLSRLQVFPKAPCGDHQRMKKSFLIRFNALQHLDAPAPFGPVDTPGRNAGLQLTSFTGRKSRDAAGYSAGMVRRV
jgi:hypothetical protein